MLLSGEIAELARRPATMIAACGAVAATAGFVALGSGYPGPVAPHGLRAVVLASVLVSTAGLIHAAPASWRDVPTSLPIVRIGVLASCLGGLLGLVKVGLHDTTPGPALGPAGRWLAVAVGVLIVAVATRHRAPP